MTGTGLRSIQGVVLMAALLGLATACATVEDKKTISFDTAKETLARAAQQERARVRHQTFEQFLESVYREPFDGGKYIVNGDTPIANKKQLREFFERKIQNEPEPLEGLELIVAALDDQHQIWNNSTKKNLTYCVSEEFESRYDQVAGAIEAAAGAWEAAIDVDFVHNTAADADCTATNAAVVFDVRPVNVLGRYLARAFFPNEPRAARNILIDKTAFELSPGSALTLTGILRHELGHTLGFRHEHTRPEAAACFEDTDWLPVSDYDPFSVMHYPQCNGLGDWSLTLTATDKTGAACVYGAAAGVVFDYTVCPDGAPIVPAPQASTTTQNFINQTVGHNDEVHYGPFKVVSGSVFDARMRGVDSAGDPDLYVRFGAEPQLQIYNCRPYLIGAEESCQSDVPADQRLAFIMVYGYSAGRYDLEVIYTPPAD